MKTAKEAVEEQFCQRLARAENYTEAYIATHPRAAREDRKLVGTRASKLAAKPHIRKRVAEILKSSQVNDLMSLGETAQTLARNIAKAEESGDYKAVMAGIRLQAQMLGGLQSTVVVMEEAADPRSLVDRLARGRPELAHQLSAVLADDGFGTAPGRKTVQ